MKNIKVLFGISFGDESSWEIANVMRREFLKHDNITVDWVITGNNTHDLSHFKVEDKFDYIEYDEPSFYVDKDMLSIEIWRTLTKGGIFKAFNDYRHLKEMIEGEYQLAYIYDEPITAWACTKADVPSILLGHKAAINWEEAGADSLTKTILHMRTPATLNLASGFSRYGPHVSLLPPIFDAEKYKEPIDREAEKVFVYLPSYNLKSIKKMLEHDGFIRRKKIVVFTNEVEEMIKERNTKWTIHVDVEYHPYDDRENFDKELLSSNYIVCETNFSLIASAINLGMRINVIKKDNPYDTYICESLRDLNLGNVYDSIEHLGKDASNAFINWNSNNSFRYPNTAETLVEATAEGVIKKRSFLSGELWDKATKFGPERFNPEKGIEKEEIDLKKEAADNEYERIIRGIRGSKPLHINRGHDYRWEEKGPNDLKEDDPLKSLFDDYDKQGWRYF